MLKLIIRWIKGYLYVELRGCSPERFINLCRNHCIYIWKVAKIDCDYRFYIYIDDYFKLKDIARKTSTYPHIIKKCGAPIVVSNLIKRKSLVPAFALFVITIYVLSGYVWNIEITGQRSHTSEELLEYVETINVFTGMKTGSVNGDAIEKSIRNEYDDISWVSVELRGCNIYIRIMEADTMESVSNEDKEYSSIVASSDGTVSEIITRTGTPLVKPGDTVTKGQVLVSGTVDIHDDSGTVIKKKPVYADADVMINTQYDYNDIFSVIYEDKYRTGRSMNEYSITFKDDTVFLKNMLNKFETYEKYDIINEYVNLYLIGDLFKDLHICKKTLYEYETVYKTYSNDEACIRARNNLKKFLNKLYDNGVIVNNKNVIVSIKDGICNAKGYIYVTEPQIQRVNLNEQDWSVSDSDGYNADID